MLNQRTTRIVLWLNIYSNRVWVMVRVRVRVSLNSQLVLEKPISSLVDFKVCLCHVCLCHVPTFLKVLLELHSPSDD